MPVVELTKVNAPFNAITKATPVAGSTDGVTYILADHDESMILVAQNTGASAYNLTLKAPANKIWTSASADVVLSIPAGDIAVIPVESAKFLDVTTGKVEMDIENVALKFTVFDIG